MNNNKKLIPKHQLGKTFKFLERAKKAWKYLRYPRKTYKEEQEVLKTLKSNYSDKALEKLNGDLGSVREKSTKASTTFNTANNTSKQLMQARKGTRRTADELDPVNEAKSAKKAYKRQGDLIEKRIGNFDSDKAEAFNEFDWDWTYPRYIGYGAYAPIALGVGTGAYYTAKMFGELNAFSTGNNGEPIGNSWYHYIWPGYNKENYQEGVDARVKNNENIAKSNRDIMSSGGF